MHVKGKGYLRTYYLKGLNLVESYDAAARIQEQLTY